MASKVERAVVTASKVTGMVEPETGVAVLVDTVIWKEQKEITS